MKTKIAGYPEQPGCPPVVRLFIAAILCSLCLTGCGLIGVNQISPAPVGANVKNGTAPDGTRPGH